MAPATLIIPAAPAFSVRPWPAPSTVLFRMMSSATPPAEVRTTGLVRVMAVAKAMPSFVLLMLPPREFVPAPSCVNSVPTVRLAPTAVVKTPALVTSMLPPTAFAPAAPIVRAAPVKSKRPDRLMRPLKVVVPVPAFWVKLVAVTPALKVAPAAFMMRMASMAPPPPKAPPTEIVPAAPAFMVRSRPAPSTVEEKAILSPAPPPLVTTMSAARVTGPVKPTAASAEV